MHQPPPVRPGGADPARVLVAGEQRMVVEAVAAHLDGRGHDVVAVTSTVSETRRALLGTRPDIIVVDEGPSGIGSTLLVALRETGATFQSLLLTTGDGPEDVSGALRAGFDGLVPKTGPLSDLCAAITRVRSGEKAYAATSLAAMLLAADEVTADAASVLVSTLTDRELEVLRLLAADRSTREIAAQMYLSVHTVRNHIRRTMEKLEVRTRSGAVAVAVEAGVVMA